MARIWVYLSATPLLWLAATLLAYEAGSFVFRRAGGRPLFHPVPIAVALLIGTLAATDTAYETYFGGAQFVHFLLGPATVALAVPLYENRAEVRRAVLPMLLALVAGSATAIVSAVGVARLFGASRETLLSLAPKSATTPIAMGISEQLGGLPSLTAALVIATGILGAVVVTPILNLLRIRDALRGAAPWRCPPPGARSRCSTPLRRRPLGDEQAPHRRLQLVGKAGLLQEEVRAGSKRLLARLPAHRGGEDDDRRLRRVRALPQLAQHRDAVHPRQREVEDDQVIVRGNGQVERLRAVRRSGDLEALQTQELRIQLAGVFEVVDDEDSGRHRDSFMRAIRIRHTRRVQVYDSEPTRERATATASATATPTDCERDRDFERDCDCGRFANQRVKELRRRWAARARVSVGKPPVAFCNASSSLCSKPLGRG